MADGLCVAGLFASRPLTFKPQAQCVSVIDVLRSVYRRPLVFLVNPYAFAIFAKKRDMGGGGGGGGRREGRG